MGSGSSNNRKVNRFIQVPSPSKVRTRTPSPVIIPQPSTSARRPYSSEPSPWLTKIHRHHHHQSNVDLAHYASIWERNGKLSAKFQQLIRSGSFKMEHNQKESNHVEMSTKQNSHWNGAIVESILQSDVDTVHSLSTPERLDTLILNLKQTHIDFDQSVKERVGQITSETESILTQIVEETQQNQQDLLIYAKEQQILEDEHYRLLLEEFVKELDEKRAKQLSAMHEQLQQQRLEIFNQSQLKLRALNEQANSLKNLIMSEEERKTSERIETIVTEINTITSESAIQDIQTEITSNVHLTVTEKVPSNQFFEHQQILKRTTLIESHRTNDQQHKSNQQLSKQTPINPTRKT